MAKGSCTLCSTWLGLTLGLGLGDRRGRAETHALRARPRSVAPYLRALCRVSARWEEVRARTAFLVPIVAVGSHVLWGSNTAWL